MLTSPWFAAWLTSWLPPLVNGVARTYLTALCNVRPVHSDYRRCSKNFLFVAIETFKCPMCRMPLACRHKLSWHLSSDALVKDEEGAVPWR